ncbi:MAG: phycocyanobilin lyase [Phormidesmis priestleyi]|uniref:Phycocyanobilin lyase n=1 Tax=Phormidesmis priestleyi TaxID=268141 RepID=A0A2W4WHU3_9CYAN|nr:MAG: phycocyanobilin lyase [Phormidesmis priestleyi]
MNISEIKLLLVNEDPQLRLRGLVALKDYEAETAVPILIGLQQDEAFLVRSFVAMGLGRKRNPVAYAALLEMLRQEPDHNVQAEIANSLGLYGAIAAEALVTLFTENSNWLVRRSILAIMPEMKVPQKLMNVTLEALKDTDETIVQAGISTLGLLANTSEAAQALAALLPFTADQNWRSRMSAAYALKPFRAADIESALAEQAQTALAQLRQDPQHQVVAAALEDLLPT